jgi:hypothetical protein
MDAARWRIGLSCRTQCSGRGERYAFRLCAINAGQDHQGTEARRGYRGRQPEVTGRYVRQSA